MGTKIYHWFPLIFFYGLATSSNSFIKVIIFQTLVHGSFLGSTHSPKFLYLCLILGVCPPTPCNFLCFLKYVFVGGCFFSTIFSLLTRSKLTPLVTILGLRISIFGLRFLLSVQTFTERNHQPLALMQFQSFIILGYKTRFQNFP